MFPSPLCRNGRRQIATAQGSIPLATHIIPAVLLAFFMLVVLGRDIFFAPANIETAEDAIVIDPNPRLSHLF